MRPLELDEQTSWASVDLSTVLTAKPPTPTMLPRSDGQCLIYPGKIHALNAEPEALKTWLALCACGEELRNSYSDANRILYLDFEDSAPSILGRLRALGLSHEEIIEGGFGYANPSEAIIEGTRSQIDFENLYWLGPDLVVIDGLTESFATQHLNPLDNADVAAWLDLIVRPLTRAGVGEIINGGFEDEYVRQHGAAVLLLDHVVKDKDARGRYALGAGHKLAGVDVAYSLRVVQPFARGRDGLVVMKVEKDRPRQVRAFADDSGHVALVRAQSLEDGGVRITLDPPEDTREAPRPSFRPAGQMERISRTIETEPGLSKKSIRAAVSGKNEWKDLALELLLAESYIEARVDGQAHRHYSLKPFREWLEDDDNRAPESGARSENGSSTPQNGPEEDRAPVPQPCPDRAPGTVDDRAPVPPPLKGGTGPGTNGTGATVPRAPNDPPEAERVVERIRQANLNARCTCVDGPAVLVEGCCSRCWGWPAQTDGGAA